MRTTIQGIPCQVRVTSFTKGYAAKTNAEVDFCHESEPDEIEFDVLDRKGRPAPWLARKLTAADIARIESEILVTAGETA